MARNCKYYLNGIPSDLYNDLYGYMDTIAPEKKSVEQVYKILKRNKIATRVRGTIYLTQPNVPYSLREINRINRKYPGLLETEFVKMTPRNIYSDAAELHILTINENILKNIPAEGIENADLISDDQTEIDQYVKLVAGEESATQDYYLDETARRENTSDQQKFSNMEREEIEIVEQKATHLQEAFAAAGVNVEIEYDTELEAIANVKPKPILGTEEDWFGTETVTDYKRKLRGLGASSREYINTKPILITINPNKVKEDTVYEEFGHIYIDMLGVNNPIVAKAIEELRDTPLYLQVQEQYPELKGERLDKEVLATAIGIEGAKITRKNPTFLQRIINRIMRAFSNMLNTLGLITTPNTAAIIAQEMFAKKLRASEMINPLSPYIQESRDQVKFNDIVNELKVRIESEIYEIEQLPIKEQEKILLRKQRLRAGLEGVKNVEDLFKFVNAMADSLASAYSNYNKIMDLPLHERASYENMNAMFMIKTELDALSVIQPIKRLMLVKRKAGKITHEGNFAEMEDRIKHILDTALVLNEDFNDDILPMMADILSGYHNKALDPQLQAQIDNAREHKRTQGLNKSTIEYKELQKRHRKGDLTDAEFLDKKVELKIEQLKGKMIPGYGALLKQLKAEHKDKSYASYLFDPLIYSSDASIQLFVKSVQDANLKTDDATRKLKGDLKEEYDLFTEGKSEFDIEKLNNDLLEEITIGGKKRLSLIQPIDVNRYEEERRNIKETLRKKYNAPQPMKGETWESQTVIDRWKAWRKSDTYTRYNKEVQDWVDKNTQEIEGARELLKNLRSQIKQSAKLLRDIVTQKGKRTDEYSMQAVRLKALQDLLKQNYNNQLGKFRGDWVQPKRDVYANPKYAKIQSDTKLKRYYDFALKEFQKAHKMIGTAKMDKNAWDEFSYLMPSIRKKDIDRMKEQGLISGVKDMLKEGFSIVETDDEFGTYDQNSGELNKRVPVYYTNRVDAKDISRDIASSLYQFRHMAHNFKHKSEILGHVMLFRDMISNRKFMETNSAGVEYINKTAERMGFRMPLKKEGETNTFKSVDEWIDMVMFGQRELKQNFNIFGKEMSWTKAVGTINSFTALNMLSFNLLQGVNQSILDNFAMFSEGIAGEFMNKSEWAWGKTKYWTEGGAINDIGRFMPRTKLGKAMEFFDSLTEFHDQEGKKLVGGKARKALQTGNLLFIQQAAEHELSGTRLLGLMRSLKGKLKDSNGNVIMNEEGKPADLYDLLKVDEKGVMSVDPRVDNFNRLDFIGLVHGLSRRTNQVKGKIHSDMASRRAQGKLVMLFRRWILPGFRRRYGHGGFSGSTLHVDEELGAVTQGMYISFWNMMGESISNQSLPWTTYKKMTKMEQQNVNRTLVEYASLLSAMVAVGAILNLDDDEETWISNFMLYQAKRYQTEILQWTPVVGFEEALRILRSPTATARPIERGLSLMNHIVRREVPFLMGIPWIDETDIYYQRKTGRFEKGDRKIRKKFEDLLPVVRGIRKSQTPREAYKWFTTLER